MIFKKVSIYLDACACKALAEAVIDKSYYCANVETYNEITTVFEQRLYAQVLYGLWLRLKRKQLTYLHHKRSKMRSFTLNQVEAVALFNTFGIDSNVDTYTRNVLNHINQTIHKALI
jgi:DNA-directed RNA polymerase specialized sigma54-like protein